MGIGNRIKQVRQELKMTQQEFADRISTTQNTIARYETEIRTPSNSTINLISRVFNINEKWLQSNIGEMFLKTDDANFSELINKYNLKDNEKEFINIFLNFTNEERQKILEAIQTIAKINDKL